MESAKKIILNFNCDAVIGISNYLIGKFQYHQNLAGFFLVFRVGTVHLFITFILGPYTFLNYLLSMLRFIQWNQSHSKMWWKEHFQSTQNLVDWHINYTKLDDFYLLLKIQFNWKRSSPTSRYRSCRCQVCSTSRSMVHCLLVSKSSAFESPRFGFICYNGYLNA
jgi:hypothetical protein